MYHYKAGEKAYYEKDLAMIKPTSAPTKKGIAFGYHNKHYSDGVFFYSSTCH